MVDTPNDVDYQTPRDDVVRPHEPLSPGSPENHNEALVVESEDPTTGAKDAVQDRLFHWKSDSMSGIVAMFHLAQMHANNANLETAELLFLKALRGYGILLGPTHEDTINISIVVANFYNKQGRFMDADMIVEDLCQHHIERFGIKHRRTQQVFQQAADLLNGCNRPNDALAFVSRSKKLAEADAEEAFIETDQGSKTRRQGSTSPRYSATPSVSPLVAAQEITAGSNPVQVESRIQFAKTHAIAKDEAMEALFEAVTDQCEYHREIHDFQTIRAACGLSDLSSQLREDRSHNCAFYNATLTVEAIICRQKWTKECFQSFETMEVLLTLVASVLKAGYDSQAAAMFTKIGQKAEDDFGWDDKWTIWARIFIGIVYQIYRSWERAESWFESARVASIAANGEEDGITRSLQTTMERRHFSERHFSGPHFRYVLDTGRPFIDIYGVLTEHDQLRLGCRFWHHLSCS